MYAIVKTGGKQYRVAPGEVVRIGKVAGDVGAEVELPALAVFQDGGELLAGADAGKVKGTIVANGRGKKVLVFKFKRKKQYKRTQGHRQDYTDVKVGDISV